MLCHFYFNAWVYLRLEVPFNIHSVEGNILEGEKRLVVLLQDRCHYQIEGEITSVLLFVFVS